MTTDRPTAAHRRMTIQAGLVAEAANRYESDPSITNLTVLTSALATFFDAVFESSGLENLAYQSQDTQRLMVYVTERTPISVEIQKPNGGEGQIRGGAVPSTNMTGEDLLAIADAASAIVVGMQQQRTLQERLSPS